MDYFLQSTAILACGGSSTRMGENKLLIDLCGKSCLLRSCEALANSKYVTKIIIAAPEDMFERYAFELRSISKPVAFVKSGETRTESVKNAALAAIDDIIIIHDGARPLVSVEEIDQSVLDAKRYGSSIICTPSKDTVRIATESGSYAPDRSGVYIVRTPQTFMLDLYLAALDGAKGDFTDDSQILQAIGFEPHITIGKYENIKLTTPEDVAVARAIISAREEKNNAYRSRI